MSYTENLILWYQNTLALVTERINETKGRNLSSEQVGLVISNHYNFLTIQNSSTWFAAKAFCFTTI